MTSTLDGPTETFVEGLPDKTELPPVLPVLPVRDVVIFPNMVVPLFVGRAGSVNAVEKAGETGQLILLLTQQDEDVEEPGPEDIYTVGTIASILKTVRLADGRVKILTQGLSRVRVGEFTLSEEMMEAGYEVIEPAEPEEMTPEIEALMRSVREVSEKILSLSGLLSSDVVSLLDAIEEPGRLADLIASNMRLKIDEAQVILETFDPLERLKAINANLNRELEVASVKARIQSEAKEEMGRGQRDYYLREQLKAIRRELGEAEDRGDEVEYYAEALDKAKLPAEAAKEAQRELGRLARMHADSAEAALIRTYLDWLIELPWAKSTRDKLDIKAAKKVLDQDHYDLLRVKERILEYLAVRKLNKNMKGPILCFVGPPGVGKTSLGKSIARAMGRRFVRVSLGGMRDEAEIRGHRRTYVGALPGRVIQGLKTAGSRNPVFMLDELDKIGADFRGDPAAALLEVLDPEQNDSFSDHYLNLAFDLSRVMFLTTANLVDPIPSALYDRLEIIELPGYTENEKVEIAKRFLLPRQVKDNGLKPGELKITDATIRRLINDRTREAGVRGLERALSALARKAARKKAEGGRMPFTVGPGRLDALLGPPDFLPEMEQDEDEAGVVTGLAWTSAGGEVLYVEASILKGKGNLTLTGQLGEVMKESAEAALSYLRGRAAWLDLPDDFTENIDIHIHLPSGAIPKDGPSAGVSLTTALTSALTGIPVRRDVAMTGEISLRGKILPIGGLKEKALAALRAKVKVLVVPEKNKPELRELDKEVKRKLDIRLVSTMDEVLEIALTEPLPGPKPAGPIEPPVKRRTEEASADPVAQ